MFKCFFKLFSLTFLFYSCKQNEDKNFYWISFHGSDYEKIDTNQIFHIDSSQSGDTTKISYFSQHDTLNYLLLHSTRDSSLIKSSYDDDGHIRALFDTTVVLDKDTFNITEYVLNEIVTDGSSIHYYTPSLGIFTTHSGTWPGIRILQSSDTVTNRKVRRLIKAAVPNFFVRGVTWK